MFCKDTKIILNRTNCKNFYKKTLLSHTLNSAHFLYSQLDFMLFRAKTSETGTAQHQNKQTDYQQNETYRLFF